MTDHPSTTPDAGSGWAVPGSGPATSAPTLAAPPTLAPRPRWTPPPPRGLLPLRPLRFGAVLGAPFRLQRRTPTSTLAPALLLSLVTTLAAEGLRRALVADIEANLDSLYYSDYSRWDALRGALEGAAGWGALALGLAASAALAGILSVPLSRALLAERVSPRGLGWRLRGRRARLAVWATLVLVATGAIITLLSLGPLTLAFTVEFTGGLLSSLLAIALMLAAGLPLALVAAKLSFVAPVLALEGRRLGAAIARSWRLTRGSLARLWGSYLLVGVMVALATFLLTQPLSLVLGLGVGLVFPNGATPAEAEAYAAVVNILTIALTIVVGAFGLVLQAGTATLLYLDQRMRLEGLDHELARYVDDRQRGAEVVDPFPVAPTRAEGDAA